MVARQRREKEVVSVEEVSVMEGGEVYSVLTCGRSECYAKWRRRRWRKESMRAAGGGGGGESCRVTVWRSQ